MGFQDMSSPWDMRTSFWVAGIVFVVGVYAAPLVVEYQRRSEMKAELMQRWLSDCSSVEQVTTCEREFDANADTCWPQARTVRRDDVVFRADALYECMNQRNSVGFLIPVPEPEP